MTVNGEHPPTETRIHPTGWESSPESERYTLGLMGHMMPKIYVSVAEVFALPANTDTDAIVKSMAAGLEFTVSQFPVLAGLFELDENTGSMWVTKKRDSTVSLHIKHMLHEDDFPSYQDLEKTDFPASLLAVSKLLPESMLSKRPIHTTFGDNEEGGIPIAAFQISFIRGGLIVCLGIHHTLTDGPGCDGFLTTWAENSAAAAKGAPFVPTRQQFNIPGSALDIQKPSPERMAELETTCTVLKNSGGPIPPPPPDFKMPSLTPQMWHFPRSKAAALKARASSSAGGQEEGWISTYDAITALLWSRITSARLDLRKPDLDSPSVLVHAVNSRKLWDPPLPAHFLGVGAAPARAGPLAIGDLVAADQLPRVAASVRASIRALTPPFLTGLLQWTAGQGDRRWLGFDVDSFLGPDLVASSWQSMSAYERHDFGFGLPRALRWPSPPFDGLLFLYPSRAGVKDGAVDEGVEVCVCLERGCQERLKGDEVLLAYAEPRGP